jgi:hypothetical protein
MDLLAGMAGRPRDFEGCFGFPDGGRVNGMYVLGVFVSGVEGSN